MRTRLRILELGLFALALAFSFASQAVGQVKLLYATDRADGKIYEVDVSKPSTAVEVTTTLGGKKTLDSLIFAPNSNILYTVQGKDLSNCPPNTPDGQLGTFDLTTKKNTITCFNPGLGTPGDLTLEPSKTSVLIADATGGRIFRYHLNGILDKALSCTFSEVAGLTYDNSTPTPNLFAVVKENSVGWSVAQIDPVTGCSIKKLTITTDVNTRLDGMTIDPSPGGYLWVSAFTQSGIYRIPTDLSGYAGPFASSITQPDGLEADGNGNIFVASYDKKIIYQYVIATDTVNTTNWPVPGLDDLAPYVYLGSRPLGYVEICKQSDPSHPVTGTFDFTVTAPFFTSNQVEVPVGDCSGPVQAPTADPHGVVTVNETPTIGDLVSNVTAYSYDKYGFYVDELKSWTLPELHADVYVVPGDVELETVATFTNYAAPPGQLKICKIAGTDDLIDKGPFTFSVQQDGQLPVFYYIKAGPADQGGYCQLAGTFAANTPLLVGEPPMYNDPQYKVSNISVDPADRGSNYNYTTQSVIVTICEGITEVAFTNIKKGKQFRCLACPN